jgi:riboflavin synthase
MFTGLIREIGTIKAMAPRGGVVRLDIEAPLISASSKPGQSIAVNGICLTVTAINGRCFSVEAATETRRLTTLENWRRGNRVHLEPALRAGDALDGHLVQGHVDGVGRISSVKKSGGSLLVTITLEPALARFLTPKGSVAVDGVSLTVDEGPFTDRFTVNLIPHTMQGTNFGTVKSGRHVNLEMDVLVKSVRTGNSWPGLTQSKKSPAESKPAGLTLEQLLAKGFGRLRTKGRK